MRARAGPPRPPLLLLGTEEVRAAQPIANDDLQAAASGGGCKCSGPLTGP